MILDSEFETKRERERDEKILYVQNKKVSHFASH